MVNARVNPEPLAEFLYKLSLNKHEISKYLTWISTYQDSKQRAEDIIKYSNDKSIYYEPILFEETWAKIKVELEYSSDKQAATQ